MVDRTCKTCKKIFEAFHKDARYCSKSCHNKSPEQKKRVALHHRTTVVKTAQNVYRLSAIGKKRRLLSENKAQINIAIRRLNGRPGADGIAALYSQLEGLCKRDREKSGKLFKYGKPDCIKWGVEYKFGRDWLRANQIVFNILCGKKFKVRWFPSHDSLEQTLRSGKDRSILFASHLRYLVACENKEIQPE